MYFENLKSLQSYNVAVAAAEARQDSTRGLLVHTTNLE